MRVPPAINRCLPVPRRMLWDPPEQPGPHGKPGAALPEMARAAAAACGSPNAIFD